jgi:hypothetical protein
MPRKLTLQEVKVRIHKMHGDTIILVEPTYISTSKKCTFIHIIYGQWETTPSQVMAGHSHPDSKRSKPKLSSEVINKRLKKIHGDVVSIDYSTFINVNEEARFIDKEHGEFWCKPNDVFTRGVGHNNRRQEKTKKTWQLKYGVDNVSQSDEIKRKKETIYLERYGVKHPGQIEEGKERRRKTSLKKYGTIWPIQNEEVKKKREKTYLDKYGVIAPSQNPIIALKQAKSANKTVIKFHWKTNEELICQGSYESKTVDYLNANQINFEWQPKVFTMPNGKTYRPDLYLIDRDIWIEIKGYMRQDAQLKWDWFKSEQSTAELWNEKKLKELCIL